MGVPEALAISARPPRAFRPRCRKRIRGLLALLPILLLSAAPSGTAAADWTFELFVGIPFGFPSPLTIRQAGRPDITARARYESRPFRKPIYYGWRIGRWDGSRGWEIELLHDKLYLADKPREVDEFAISHGFNLLTVNRVWERGGLVRRAGAGAVVAHPENTIRGKALPEDGGLLGWGYHLSGPTVQAAVEKRFRARGDLFLPIEGKATASFARVPVAEGSADVPYAALHGMAGLGMGRLPER